ncbi:hypothetical protein J14TS2_32780 [Bacillus sp. J14TS2]|uniref:class I SAM-dependent methyltransferase n=1 Tax=Bacillus sp. J14TS2 TaxID=2807188 RepID=UPI001B1A2C38|nr:class I SAM-dependent methyltransferase [Bacillus sp. J14TS2]GIN72803.1 hypothetical protein J14TS2_32780 [Bacillus sp. J14TS2]
MGSQKVLYDVMKHPEWIPPHSEQWYKQLGTEIGEYNYPWKSQFAEPTAAMILAERISKYVGKNTRILDIGCGHGEFTYQWAAKAKEVVGIDVINGFIETANKNKPTNSIRFLNVHADEKLPFPDRYFDLVYTKKGPWLYEEASRITKPGGIIIGLFHGGTDGGLRRQFPGLYHPLPVNPFDLELIKNNYKMNELTDLDIEVIEEVEYLSTPEDILIKKCFGQSQTLKNVAWQKCLKDVEEIFDKNATSKGLKVINYHHLIIIRNK